MSPAYDLLNTRMHVEDEVFALEGLLSRKDAQGTIYTQFTTLAEKIELTEKQFSTIMKTMLGGAEHVEQFVKASFLNEQSKRNYFQAYQRRLKRLKPKL